MGCSKSSSKREFYSETSLPQETSKVSSKQPNLTPKGTIRKKTKQNAKLEKGKKSLRSEQK